jgi:hypothetical protein
VDKKFQDTSAAVGGLQKWTFDGATWSKVATFNLDDTGAATARMRGVAGMVTGNAVTLVATSADGAPNRLLMYVDDGATANPRPTLLSKAIANTIYRGVALAPKRSHLVQFDV